MRGEGSMLVGLPPPLRGRVGERGKPRATAGVTMRRPVNAHHGTTALVESPAVVSLFTAQLAAPLSLTLSRKGRGNPRDGASLTEAWRGVCRTLR